MRKQKYGRIINISSVVGLVGSKGASNYAASKAGIIGFTKSFAKEVAPSGITVNTIVSWIFLMLACFYHFDSKTRESILKTDSSSKIRSTT